MRNTTCGKLALMCAASVVALTAAAQAQAQDNSAANVEAVTVTGSRVISDITQSPTPLTVVTADQLSTTTPTSIPDALNKLPDFIGGSTPRSQNNASQNKNSSSRPDSRATSAAVIQRASSTGGGARPRLLWNATSLMSAAWSGMRSRRLIIREPDSSA